MKNISRILLIVIFVIIFLPAFISAEEAQLNSEELKQEILSNKDKILSANKNVTTATQLLAALPEREEKIPIAIYGIEDRTGKRDISGSAVITQGATDMMITALQRSGQFKILDRSILADFMNEQNLITQDRIESGEGAVIGKMSGSKYIITGSITEYQIDKKSGGLGISIGGKGGQQEYAVASCALDLRVVDTTTAEVMWARSFKKEIQGKKLSFQLFSFMGNNIVEFESGRGKQEVINFVVRTIIEESVFELVESDVF
ncbi:MAG: CsgG/HfaB family protein [bacterium]